MEAVAELVQAAAHGDQRAWDALVARFNALVWSIARAHRLPTADAADVVQTTWLRLVEQLGRLREPERVGAWLATTARRESLRTLQRAGRAVPTDAAALPETPDFVPPAPERATLVAERDRLLWRAVDDLPQRCRRLLRVLMADPPPSYEDVSAALDIPVGSIGPTRARCLRRLRDAVAAAGISADAGGSV